MNIFGYFRKKSEEQRKPKSRSVFNTRTINKISENKSSVDFLVDNYTIDSPNYHYTPAPVKSCDYSGDYSSDAGSSGGCE